MDAFNRQGAEVSVKEGPDKNDQVGHVIVASIMRISVPKVEVELPFDLGTREIIRGGPTTLEQNTEIYLSRNGVQLLQLSSKRTPGEGTSALIFAEVEDSEEKDIVSDRVFEIVPRTGGSLEAFRASNAHIASLMASTLGLSRPDYEDLVEDRFNNGGNTFFSVHDLALKGVGLVLDELKPLTNDFAKLMGQYKMPEELWKPDRMTDDFKTLVASLGQKLDTAANGVLDGLTDLPKLRIVSTVTALPGSSNFPVLLGLLSWIESTWNTMLDLVADAARFLRDNKPQAADALGALIGYYCGLWDAIVDAAAGIVEMVSLGLGLVSAFIRAQANPQRVSNFVLEAFDEVVQAISRIDWVKLWNHLLGKIIPKVVKLLRERAASLADKASRSTATAGYYFGYLVYNVVEIFFPPLKFTKVARATEAATETAQFANRVFRQ